MPKVNAFVFRQIEINHKGSFMGVLSIFYKGDNLIMKVLLRYAWKKL